MKGRDEKQPDLMVGFIIQACSDLFYHPSSEVTV